MGADGERQHLSISPCQRLCVCANVSMPRRQRVNVPNPYGLVCSQFLCPSVRSRCLEELLAEGAQGASVFCPGPLDPDQPPREGQGLSPPEGQDSS